MKNLCILTGNQKSAEEIKKSLSGYDITITDKAENLDKYYLVALYDYDGTVDDKTIKKDKIINIHSSLLPSFDTKTPIKDAYLYGAKVTGVTIYTIKEGMQPDRILAQYPVLIDNYTHYDQLEEEIEKLRLKLYPLVIKSVMEDKAFDIVELLAPTLPHSCGKCAGCSNK